jgi:Rrf2 family iron-sulfur cluster assembly transcriptional regulator
MKLSTRSRYGARMMVDLASHYGEGFVQMEDISRRQGISFKYLEQLVPPLKKANLIESVRGPKGGHRLAKHPSEIAVGEIVRVLENDPGLSRCIENPGLCERSKACPTRRVWEMATEALYDTLNSVTLADLAGPSG